MSHNPHATTAQQFQLPGHQLLSLAGRDALAFAQAQFMNDVAALPAGHWQWNGWLTPKGRLVALFALLRLDDATLWLLLPDADAATLAAQLQRFVFRSKVSLSQPALQVAGRFAEPAQASGAQFARGQDGSIELDMGGDGGPRTLRIAQAAMPEDADALARWHAADLAHGLPRLDAGQAEAWTPQQLSLDRLHAYSVKKGCYPGQEIVARTHFLGQAKRGLVRLRGTGVGAMGEVFEALPEPAGARALGRIACTTGDEALAVMPLDAGDGPFAAGGQPCVRLPLLGGLAR
jgi:folate-binding protein YgfZ